jgi:IMP dehydrogenase/GMP reductase
MKLTFDDVLIKPRFSAIDSRKEVDLTTRFQSGEVLALPLFSANMATVTGPEMSRSMLRAGGMAIMHRFYSPDVLATTFIENSGNRKSGTALQTRCPEILPRRGTRRTNANC